MNVCSYEHLFRWHTNERMLICSSTHVLNIWIYAHMNICRIYERMNIWTHIQVFYIWINAHTFIWDLCVLVMYNHSNTRIYITLGLSNVFDMLSRSFMSLMSDFWRLAYVTPWNEFHEPYSSNNATVFSHLDKHIEKPSVYMNGYSYMV